MLDDLLMYSRISSTSPNYKFIKLGNVIEGIRLKMKRKYNNKPFKIFFDADDYLVADPGLTETLFHNLIDNALKFNTADNIEINIESYSDSKNVYYSVRDNGTGINPEYHEKAFMLFQKLHNDPEIPGTGSELAICRFITEKHNGRIWLDRNYGNGAKINFTIPQ